MRTAVVLALLFACNRRDDPPAPAPAPTPPPVAVDAAVEPTPEPMPAESRERPPRIRPSEAIKNLDAMLDEIDKSWRSKKSIVMPETRMGFRVMDDNGVAVISPEIDIGLDDVSRRMTKRSLDARNKGLKQYTDGSLVAIDGTGAEATNKPLVFALNEMLIVFLTPSTRDPKLLGRVDVAMP